MTISEGIVWKCVPHTIIVNATCGDKTEFTCHKLDEDIFRQTCNNRTNATIIFSSDDVPGNKMMMKFGKERLYVMIKDDLFGVIINDSYTYD